MRTRVPKRVLRDKSLAKHPLGFTPTKTDFRSLRDFGSLIFARVITLRHFCHHIPGVGDEQVSGCSSNLLAALRLDFVDERT